MKKIRVESVRRGYVCLDIPDNWLMIQLKVSPTKPCSLREMVEQLAPFSPADSRAYQLEKHYPKLVLAQPFESLILVQAEKTRTKDFLVWADENNLCTSRPYQLAGVEQMISLSGDFDPVCLRETTGSWAGYVSLWRGVDGALVSVDEGEEPDGATHIFELCR